MDFVHVLRSKEEIELSDIEDYVRHYVDNVVPQYVAYNEEACDAYHVGGLATELQQVLDEPAGIERKLPVLFVIWTNLISALARLDVYVGAMTLNQEMKDGQQDQAQEG